MSITLTKELLVVEDIYFGFGTVAQARGVVTLLNASYLPYAVGMSVTEAIDDRYNKAASDARYAPVLGNGLSVFDVSNGLAGTNAVNFSQLALKADITAMALKLDISNSLPLDNSTPYIPLTDYNPSTKRYVDLSFVNKFALGATGTFTSADAKIVTVTGGLITGIA